MNRRQEESNRACSNCRDAKEENERSKVTAAVFGLGLIGGSFALALRDRGVAEEIVGVDTSEENARKALELGLVDRVVTHDEAVAGADLIVLATPVDATPILAMRILNRVRPGQTVMDMGSIKEELCEVI
ncbi:MAG: prephenate dehydrogenase/arogenate dehydrogenase family protein, partial [Alistipes sp.]|nr:prephenate dehydrogenase/arogenate dehydrogenase family protein [Alistipes sp.]